MKRKTLVLLFLSISITYGTYSQNINSYSSRFDDGFKKGYCYNQPINCMPPIIPVSPAPRLNESLISYTDGYYRGFQTGLDLQRIET